MRPLVLARSGWVVTLVALAVMMVTARLGFWQLERAQQKQSVGQQRQQQRALAPLTEASAEAWQTSDNARRVQLRGQWLDAHTVYLDNRQMQGQPGFFVITPLQISAQRAVVVQRGWVPRDFTQRTALPPVAPEPGQVLVSGEIALPPSALLALGAEGRTRLRQNLDWQDYQRQVGLQLGEVSVRQTGAPQGVLQRDWYRPDDKISMHHGYAFQWFGLSLLTALWYGWFYVRARIKRAS